MKSLVVGASITDAVPVEGKVGSFGRTLLSPVYINFIPSEGLTSLLAPSFNCDHGF